MTLTVRDLLADPSLGTETLVAGDLDRPIRWVHPTEQLDPTPWLRGAELVLIDGVELARGASPSGYVARLRAADVAALGYGLIDGGEPVPPALVQACAAEGLTLFTVAPEVPYLAISEAFFEHLTREREAPLRAAVRRGERLLEAATVGRGLQAVADAVQADLGRAACVLDPAGRVVAQAGEPPDPQAAEALGAAAVAPERRPRRGEPIGDWWLLPIRSIGRTEGHLAIRGAARRPTLDEQAALDQVLAFAALDLVHARALRETNRRFAAELFDLLGSEDTAAVETRLRPFGLAPDRPLVAIVCETSAPEDQLTRLELALAELGLVGLAAVKAGRILIALQWSESAEALHRLAAPLQASLPDDALLGVGGVARHVGALATSLAEASHACAVARLRRDATRFATHDEIGSHRLLLALQESDVVAGMWDGLIGPLEAYDRRRGTDLIGTLTAFLDSNGQWQATAEALHIHVNTLRQRLGRIEELTGRTLSSMDGRVDLFLALRTRALT